MVVDTYLIHHLHNGNGAALLHQIFCGFGANQTAADDSAVAAEFEINVDNTQQITPLPIITASTGQLPNGMALTKVILHTGRTHQIRVQSAAIGCPVYGDMRYGGEKAKKGFLALWATSLAFTHPVSKERLVFKIEPPKDNNPWNLFDVSKEIEFF